MTSLVERCNCKQPAEEHFGNPSLIWSYGMTFWCLLYVQQAVHYVRWLQLQLPWWCYSAHFCYTCYTLPALITIYPAHPVGPCFKPKIVMSISKEMMKKLCSSQYSWQTQPDSSKFWMNIKEHYVLLYFLLLSDECYFFHFP